MNRWGRHKVCLSKLVLRPSSVPACKTYLCTCMKKHPRTHTRTQTSSITSSFALRHDSSKFLLTNFKCNQLHGLIYSVSFKVTKPNVLESELTQNLFKRPELLHFSFFLAACHQNLNKTSKEVQLQRHRQTNTLTDLICNWFVSKYPFD